MAGYRPPYRVYGIPATYLIDAYGSGDRHEIRYARLGGA